MCVLFRFIWSVDVSRPNTTRRQVGLASFSAIHHMSAYSRSQYEKGEDIAIHPTRVYVKCTFYPWCDIEFVDS